MSTFSTFITNDVSGRAISLLLALDCTNTTSVCCLVDFAYGFTWRVPFNVLLYVLRIFIISSTAWGYWFVFMDMCWTKVLFNPPDPFLSDPLSNRTAITSFLPSLCMPQFHSNLLSQLFCCMFLKVFLPSVDISPEYRHQSHWLTLYMLWPPSDTLHSLFQVSGKNKTGS